MITKRGMFNDISSADYFSDPMPTPSLTQSIAKILIEESPLHAWHAHPRLNPDYRASEPTKFDVGNLAHRYTIGRGKEIVVLDADDWKSPKTRAVRDEHAANGKLAVLAKHHVAALNISKAVREGLNVAGLSEAFQPGHGNGEVVIAWQEGGLWMRSMLDWVSDGAPIYYDLKTTGMSVAPHAISHMMVNAGWDIQAAFQERGLDVIDPNNAGRRKFRFVAVEDDKPHAMTVCELPESVMTMGRKKVAHAIGIWRECRRTNRFPAYPAEIHFPEYPGWQESQWLQREVEYDERKRRPGEFNPEILMAG